MVEGKRDIERKMDDEFEGLEEEEAEESTTRRRVVYVLRAGKMIELQNGVEQWEETLMKRVQKMLNAA